MKKIGIDARLYNQTGVGTYIKNLLFYLDKNNSSDFLYYVYLFKKDFEKVHFQSKNIVKKEANFYWHTFSEQIGFLLTLLKDNLDLVHFTYFTFPIFYFKKFLITIHDMTPILFKTGRASTKNPLIYQIKHFIFKIVFFLGLKKSVKVIVPSKTVKEQIISYYGERFKDKIEVIYEGVSYHLLEEKKAPILENLSTLLKSQGEHIKSNNEFIKILTKSYKRTTFLLIFLIFFVKYSDLIVDAIVNLFIYTWNLYKKSSVDTQLLVINSIFFTFIGGAISGAINGFIKEKIFKNKKQ